MVVLTLGGGWCGLRDAVGRDLLPILPCGVRNERVVLRLGIVLHVDGREGCSLRAVPDIGRVADLVLSVAV
eukprot:801604-Alexandrium_andersonii.AAC.1